MTLESQKLVSFTKDVSDLNDQPAISASELKAQFDAAPNELREKFNSLIDALMRTTDGDSGADNLGMTIISGLEGSTIQAIMESLKSYTDKKISIAGTGYRTEICTGIFFTNGGSNIATANITFGTPFTSPPTIIPANITQVVSYSDVIRYPYIYDVTTTGFSVKLKADGNLGTVGSPANLFMNFIALGK